MKCALRVSAAVACLLFFSRSAYAHHGAHDIEFIPNKGQWEGDFRYKVAGARENIFLAAGSVTYVLSDPRNDDQLEAYHHQKTTTEPVLHYHAFRMFFEGGSKHTTVREIDSSDHYYNYFLGRDQSRWKGGIRSYSSVVYESLYPGIDALFGSGEGNFKYDFIVQPYAQPDKIRLRFEGAERLELRKGRLLVHTSVGTMEELAPYAYQLVDGKKQAVKAQYVLQGRILTYDFPDGYDKSRELVIDPVVVFSTYSGASAMNWGFTATYDSLGNAYAGGISFGQGYPTTPGAFESTYQGVVDIAISKYNTTGTALLYATYLGGVDEDKPHSLIVAPGGELVMAGHSFSADYPTTTGAYDPTHNGFSDLVITRFNSTGTALTGSTFVGGYNTDGRNVASPLPGNYGDESRSEVITDSEGNIYVAAETSSNNFPTVNAFQTALGGGQDAVALKFNSSLTSLLWSTYLGGSAQDGAYVLALNSDESKIYVAGGTNSDNFPTTASAYQPVHPGNVDGFIASFTNSGTFARQESTYIGTTGLYDQCYGIQVDANDKVYTMGQTTGGTFPVTPGVYSNPFSSQFVMKLSGDLSTVIYSTVFGTGDSVMRDMSPTAFLVDKCENVYVSGFGRVDGMPVTPNAIQSVSDDNDFYFIVLAKDAQSLYYGTYYGAPGGAYDHVDGGTSRFDKQGIIYQATCACFPNFPTTPGAYSTTKGAGACNTTCTKINFELTGPKASFTATPGDRGCAPFEVQFNNTSTGASIYEWDFGDQTGSTLTSPTHTYTQYGTYTVRLIAKDPLTSSCDVVDTAYLTIRVDTLKMRSDFSYEILDSCGPYIVQFDNHSNFDSTKQSFSLLWNFGDNTTSTAIDPGVHQYPDTGSYKVTLILRDSTNACKAVDSIVKVIHLKSFLVAADFLPYGPQDCDRNEVVFTNGSAMAQTYAWDFGDNTGTSTQTAPQYTYAAPGTYEVMLIAAHPQSCNKSDTVIRNVIIRHSPIASFSFDPVQQIVGEPYQFYNYSQKADAYTWHFGDGVISTLKDPQHTFMRWGQFAVCLVARTDQGCMDTMCKTLSADLIKTADVPTAFSPNGDGKNDVLLVRGTGIRNIDFRIFNRWGQLVFETNDQRRGWDGTFGGKPVEMDACAYVLKVIYLDGTEQQQQGNITILR